MAAIIQLLSMWAIPLVLGAIPLYGLLRGLPVYETFVAGAEEGFRMAVVMIPYIVGILVALSMFQAAGALDAVIGWMAGPLARVGVPPEVVPLLLVRPLSGGAALGITVGILHRYGADSLVGQIASTLQSSTDTTFYVLTLYLGSVGIRHARYALPVALVGDAAGFITAVLVCRMLWG